MNGDTHAVVQAGDIVKVRPWLVRTEEGRRGCTTRTPAPPQQLIYTEAPRAATAESSAAHPGWGSSPASYWRPVLCIQVTSRVSSARNRPLSGVLTKSIIRVWRHLLMSPHQISFRVKGNSRLFIFTGLSCGIRQSARCAVPIFANFCAYSISEDSA